MRYFPGNRGIAGKSVATKIPVGTILDRYGSSRGEFLYLGKPLFLFRSLPPEVEGKVLKFYEVKQEFLANQGRACSWYGKAGGSKIIDLGVGNTVQDLIDKGILGEVEAPKP